ncbi:MAG: hypothetical protein K0S47_4313 [Herbinix sp.]|nr:hypothetical protein [Herbinix sp.]
MLNTDNKAISAKVLVYKGTFYMKLKDIAKAADFGLSMTEDQLRYNINTKKDYNGVEAWRPDISVYKIEVDMKPVDQTNNNSDIIKSPYPDAEYIKSPRTKEDFDKLIQYMLANNIVTCNIKTNIPYEEMVKYNILADIVYTSDYLGRFENRYESLYHSSTYDLKQDGKYGMLEIKLKGHNGESDRQLKKKAKLFNDKMMEAFHEMITNEELTAEITETEKAKAIFTWIAKHVEYDWYSYLNDIDDNYTAYDALVDKTAVCAGYAGLYNLMCKYVGLYDIEYISGEADGFLGRGGHAWTAQRLDGKKVMTDATWGDTDSTEEGIDTVDYDWFARPISYFKKNNHYWDSKDYPLWK